MVADKSSLILFSFDTCVVFCFMSCDHSLLGREGSWYRGSEQRAICLNTAADVFWHSHSPAVMSSSFHIINPCQREHHCMTSAHWEAEEGVRDKTHKVPRACSCAKIPTKIPNQAGAANLGSWPRGQARGFGRAWGAQQPRLPPETWPAHSAMPLIGKLWELYLVLWYFCPCYLNICSLISWFRNDRC